jgi:hypothetical protein
MKMRETYFWHAIGAWWFGEPPMDPRGEYPLSEEDWKGILANDTSVVHFRQHWGPFKTIDDAVNGWNKWRSREDVAA